MRTLVVTSEGFPIIEVIKPSDSTRICDEGRLFNICARKKAFPNLRRVNVCAALVEERLNPGIRLAINVRVDSM